MSLTPDRRSALVAARLAAIVRARTESPVDVSDVHSFAAHGAALVVDGTAWVDPGEGGPTGIGSPMAWAMRHEVTELHMVVESDDLERLGVLARHASMFDPAPTVSRIDGVSLHPVEPARLGTVEVPPPSTAEHVLLLDQAGVEVVVESGRVLGEIRGLEVARVLVADDGSATLHVGVGRFDREAFALMHGELSPSEALGRAVDQVGGVRRPGAEPHPLNRLARERWLRHQLVADPSLVGAVELHPVESSRARGGLRDNGIAVAVGHREDGTELVVAISVGIDLEAVPLAADARFWHAPDADLILVVPPRDQHPVTAHLAARLARPATVLGLAGEWPE